MVDRKRRPVVLLIVLLLFSLAGLYRVTQSPRFQEYRTVDIVQLLGFGVCFGATMVGLILVIRGSRP